MWTKQKLLLWLFFVSCFLLVVSLSGSYGQDWVLPEQGLSHGEAIELLQIINEQQEMLTELDTVLMRWITRSNELELSLQRLRHEQSNLENSVTNLKESEIELQASMSELGVSLTDTVRSRNVFIVLTGIFITTTILGIIF
jgi:hypothetical protein